MGVEIGPVSTKIWTEISILSKVIVFRFQNRAKPLLWGPNLQIGIQCETISLQGKRKMWSK